MSQLNDLLKTITDYYLGKGCVTSRALPAAARPSTGHLQVLVVEGKLEALRSAEGSTVTDRGRRGFPGKVGEH